MGLETDSDFDKNCPSDLSPNTVLPEWQSLNAVKRNQNRKLSCKDDVLRVKDGFTGIRFQRYQVVSSKNSPARVSGVESNIELRRGSIYQTSGEVRKIKRMNNNEAREKIEISCGNNTSPLSIVDSLCISDGEGTLKKCPAPRSGEKPHVEFVTSNDFIEICTDVENRSKQFPGTVVSSELENGNLRCEHVITPQTNGNELLHRDGARKFHESLSSKLELPHSPCSTDSDWSSEASSKSRFGPIRKMVDPFMKSKSVRSPPGHTAENVTRHESFRKSLLRDFSRTEEKTHTDRNHSAASVSPVHLHGCLKLGNRKGDPYFEFSLNYPEEVLVAKTWKADNAFNWVYTFTSVSHRKKSNASGWRLIDGNKENLMVGQMQVSCYLSSEVRGSRVFDDSMVMEFVLYDLAHARHSVSTRDSPDEAPDFIGRTHKLDTGSDSVKLKYQHRHAFGDGNFDPSQSRPWPSAVLHPDLEIAAIAIQVPLVKRESLTFKRWSKSSKEIRPMLLGLSMVEDSLGTESPIEVNAMIPTGNHSLPVDDSRGPSSLLDRWRLGGGCDCGGWDMACPLTVLSSRMTQSTQDQLLECDQNPFQLSVQGTKEKTPALTLSVTSEGQYSVDFHAQFSSLQAFAICVATLHGMEVSCAADGERSRQQLPHSNSLKVFIEDEVRLVIEAITESEKKTKLTKKKEGPQQQSYVTNPPFSPMSRV